MPPFAHDPVSSVAVRTVIALAIATTTARASASDGAPTRDRPFFVRIVAATSLGDGLRFNNPYRLATPLGDRAESVSRTAPYVDLGFAGFFGDPFGAQHGPVVRFDRS